MTTYAHMDDQELATEIDSWDRMLASQREVQDRMRQELVRRLEVRGARELPHPELVVKLEYPSPVYDVGKLAAMRELVQEEVLLETKAWTPAHPETIMVPEKYDARVFRSWGKKYGYEVAAVIEGAKLPGGPAKLKITEKK